MANPFSWSVLDNLLRGSFSEKIPASDTARSLLAWQIGLAALYGLCLGLFGIAARENSDFRFMLASAAKLPVLIIGTTVVMFPSLYVFMALFGIDLRLRQMIGAVLAANTILATVIASLGPILAFFSITTSSYPFILLLNVAICGLGGILGVRVMLLAVRGALASSNSSGTTTESESDEEDEDDDSVSASSDAPRFLTAARPRLTLSDGARSIMVVWFLLYAFVGTQMAWILRPFIGAPEAPFVVFRGKSGSFVDTVLRALGQYLAG